MKKILHICLFIMIALFISSYVVLPALAVSTVRVVLDTNFLGGRVVSSRGQSLDLRTSSISDSGIDVNYTVNGHTYNCSWLEFDISELRNDRNAWGNGNIFLQFTLVGSAGHYLDNPFVSGDLIFGIGLPGYNENWLSVTELTVDGGNDIVYGGNPTFLGHSNYGINFYRFDSFYASSDDFQITGRCFTEVSLSLGWSGNPSTAVFQIVVPNDNYIIVESYSANDQGIVDGLDDIRNEVGRTNDILNGPPSQDQLNEINDMALDNEEKRDAVESAVVELDQFHKPDLTGTVDDLNSDMSAYEDELSLFKPKEPGEDGASEFISTAVSMGVPSLGLCVFGYILYGKKEG